MALHVNLYHEIQKQRQMQRRDPLKLSMFGIGAILVCFAGFYFLQIGRSHGFNVELGRVKGEFDKLEPESKAAKKHEDEINAQIRLNELMQKRMEDRFYWAPLLEQVMQVVPPEVQITKFGGDLTGEGRRKCSLTIDGLSAGADPRKVAEDLRTAIGEKFAAKYKNVTSNFKSLDDGTELVSLEGKQLPTASFAINVVMFWGEDLPTTPAPRKR